jgi:hypothetical protein
VFNGTVINPAKTTDLPQVTDKLYHIGCVEYTSPERDSNLSNMATVTKTISFHDRNGCLSLLNRLHFYDMELSEIPAAGQWFSPG